MDEDLLRQARELGARWADAQRQAELDKATYHHAVRRLHFAGASLREIAEALDLSHQRVHQIIEATGGTGGWKSRKKAATDLTCTFCGLPKDECAKLIAGPGVFICGECVALVHRVAEESQPVETPRTRLDLVPKVSRLACSFCGKEARKVNTVVTGPGVRICKACLQLCDEILAATS